MKKRFLAFVGAAALALPLGASAQYVDYVYEGIIDTEDAFPLAIAASSTGELFFATFYTTGGGRVTHIADPVAAIDTSGNFPATPSGTDIFEVTGWPASRGLQGIQVDSNGDVYVSGDDGSTTYIKKLDASNSYAEDGTFTVSGSTRIGGIALLNDDILAATQFGSLLFFNTNDGSAATPASVAGGTIYQREAVFNPTDNVFYPMANGDFSATIVRGYFSGGTPTDLGSFAFTADALVTDGASATQFGLALQNGYFDTVDNQLITCDSDPNASTKRQVRIWDVSNNGTELTLAQAIDGDTLDGASQGQPFPLTAPRDAVRIGDRLFVTSTDNSGSIYVFVKEGSSVSDWTFYQ